MTIEFFFDIASPYSYLAATQVADIEARTGAKVQWRPFLLGGVFKSTGNTMPARVENKASWMLRDLRDWADHYGVDFRFSSHFPLNALLPQRVLTACAEDRPDAVRELALALYRDHWVDDVDVSTPEALRAAADRVGLDGEALVERATEQSIKDRLRSTTDEAVDRGAFGAPTFFVGDRMFWGNDRLHFLVDAATPG